MYSSIQSVDDALNSRPHILDGKEVDPKRAVARDVCNVVIYTEYACLVYTALVAVVFALQSCFIVF